MYVCMQVETTRKRDGERVIAQIGMRIASHVESFFEDRIIKYNRFNKNCQVNNPNHRPLKTITK